MPQCVHGVETGLQVLTLLSLSLSESWHNNRDLLRILQQDRRRRQVAPEEKDPFLEETPLFAKPYKVMAMGCRLEGEEEGGLGWEKGAVSSARAVADLSLTTANTAASHVLH